MMKLIEKFI